jgi:ribonuclease PH
MNPGDSQNGDSMARPDGRGVKAMRRVRIETPFFRHAEGSASIRVGETWVVCAATVEERVPSWLRGKGRGWITADYDMLPRSTTERVTRGGGSGRTQEIRRLVGRSLRAVADLSLLGERRIILDCDVMEADGGTRTAAVTGAYVALHEACRKLLEQGSISAFPLRDQVAGISVGVVNGETRLDLCYEEDQHADVDLNVVMTGSGDFVEVQGTAEGRPFSQQILKDMLKRAAKGIRKLHRVQARVLPWVAPEEPDA